MRAKRHIVMITGDFYPDSTGGVQRVVYYLSRGLVAKGHRVTVVTRRVSGELPVHETIEGIAVARFSSNAEGVVRFHTSEFASSRRLFSSVINRDPPDLVHVHEPLPGLGAVSALAGTHIPSVYTFHGQWSVQWLDARLHGSRGGGMISKLFAGYLRSIERVAMRRAKRLVALSRFMAETAVDLYSVPRGKVRIIPNGVDLAHFHTRSQRAAREQLGLPSGQFLLGFAGRLSGEKGLSLLLRCMAILKGEKGGHLLAVAGTGPEGPALEEQVDRLGLQDRVRFLGHVEDMPSFYNAVDLLIVPSVREPFGLITLEALACGTPVLGGPVGGTAEILEAFDRRFLFAASTPEAMAAKIGAFDRRPAAGLRRHCRDYVEHTFSWDRMVDRYEQLYTECIAP